MVVDTSLDILAIAAHPDDAELGCGGSLLLATRKGLSIAIADLSTGEMSSRGTVTSRQTEATNAARVLGLKERRNLGLPDSKIGENSSASRSALIQLIRETRPRIVLAPYWEDRHPDHEATRRLVKEACFFAGVAKTGDGEPYRPAWLFIYMISYPLTPAFVPDISDVWERKLEPIKAYGEPYYIPGLVPVVELPDATTSSVSDKTLPPYTMFY